MSSDSKSISSGLSLPQWMKNKIDNRVDYDATAFSPPSHDDNFFYIRYPVSNTKNELGVKGTLTEAIHNASTSSAEHDKKPVDLTKHTISCKQYIQGATENSTSKGQTKSHGTDDGFKGAGAACGSSIVKVAQKVVSGKHFGRGFTVANFDEADVDTISEEQNVINSAKNMMRRGSKSLPASPLGSPKLLRKASPNPYFTGAFAVGPPTTEQRGWFLSSLLGIQKEVTSSTVSIASHIDEEGEEALDHNTHNNNVDKQNKPATINPSVLKAKPSELREMNFWSPTSM